jgi:hypothetical protein
VGLDEVPQTGSGKVKKHVLRSVGQRLVDERAAREGQGRSVETIFEYVFDENML